MNHSRNTGFAAVGAMILGIASAVPATAQEVVLRSNDGSATIRGELIEFADGFYRLRTELGELRLSASRMICEGDGCPQLDTVEADVTFAGSDAIATGIMPLLMAGWAFSINGEADVRNGNEPGTQVAEIISDQGFGEVIGSFLVRSSTADDAFSALEQGTAEVGLSTRRILPPEARALRAAGAGNMVDPRQERILAVDPLTIIVHPSNRIGALSPEQLARIFSGEITRWSELGGPNTEIDVFVREEGSATRGFFEERIMEGRALSPKATIVEDNSRLASAVTSNLDAIGYVGYAFQRGAKPIALTSSCGIEALPSPFRSKTEEYPLDRRLYLYAREDTLTDKVVSFLDFATSPEADGAIAKSGFIDLSVSRQPMEVAEARAWRDVSLSTDGYERGLLAELAGKMHEWDRLSTTLRFATGSSQLDERGRIDLERLIDYLEFEPKGTRIAVVGFTDSDGAFEGNRVLANQRAEQALRQIQRAGAGRLDHIQFTPLGYGELSPSACNDSNPGKRINRRVEIWIQGPEGSDSTTTN